MLNKTTKGNYIIATSFIVAFILTALPLPDSMLMWRPSWVLLVLIYWCMAIPNKIGIGTAWFLGLMLDVQQSAIFGQNALGLALIAYLVIKSYKLIRVFPLTQQAFIICFFLLIYKSNMFIILYFINVDNYGGDYWMPVVSSAILWPWLFILLRYLRRKYNI